VGTTENDSLCVMLAAAFGLFIGTMSKTGATFAYAIMQGWSKKKEVRRAGPRRAGPRPRRRRK